MIDWAQLSDILKRQKKAVLLELLEQSFFAMEPKQQRAVFGETRPGNRRPPGPTGGGHCWRKWPEFDRDSRARKYYQSFMINSKNFNHIPDKTDEWFDRLGRPCSRETSKLTQQGITTRQSLASTACTP